MLSRAALVVVAVGLAGCAEDPVRAVDRGAGDQAIARDLARARDGAGAEPAAALEGGALGEAGGPRFPTVSGKATYYDADGSGNCGFEPTGDLMVGAMNQVDYAGSEACGACVSVTGPKGTITIRIVDRCPECAKGHIDLSQEAFAKIAEVSLGVVPITWSYVACPVSGPIAYKIKEGSNQWWTALQVRDTRYAVKTLQAKVKGAFVTLPRETYNYFIAASGLGVGPYELPVTDVLGAVLIDTGIPLKPGQVVPGAAQFPP